LTIEANDDIDGVELQMFDMQGKHVRSFRLNSLLSGNTSSVPLDVPSGIYVIKAIRDFKLFTQKIIVQ
jgi:hypothetical protein